MVVSSPYYDIRFPNTDHFLVACYDHPIHLYQALPPDQDTPEHDACHSEGSPSRDFPLASYPLVSPTTEAYHQVHSLVWPSPGTHFLVGSRDLIAQFDITRNGEGPVTRVPTIPSRRHVRKGNGIGMRGTVSALSAQTTADDAPTGLIAAGTWTRRIGLYDVARGCECVSTWGVDDAAAGVTLTEPPADFKPPPSAQRVKGIGGAGISQTAWSPCGRYLLVDERQSTGMLVYDVRVTNKLLGCLAGRDALTHQRLGCDVFRGLEDVGGFEVWAGTRDGTVKVWEGIGNVEGCQWPSWDFSAVDGGAGAGGKASPALGGVGLHHSGSVVATCSGCWTVPDDDEDDESSVSSDESEDSSASESSGSSCERPARRSDLRRIEESSLRLWQIGPPVSNDHMPVVEESARIVMPTDEMSEIEKYKMRMYSALDTMETEDEGPETAPEVKPPESLAQRPLELPTRESAS